MPRPDNHSTLPEPLLDHLSAQWSTIAAPWSHPADIRADARAWLTTELARRDDLAAARDLHATIRLGTPADYLPRLITAAGLPILCGIQFFGGDPAHPFLDILSAIPPDADPAPIATAALAAMPALAPRRIRFLRPGTTPPPPTPGWLATPDHILFANRATDILAAPPPPARCPPITLEPADLDDAMAFMTAGYQRLAAHDPELARRVPPSTREQLLDCLTTGLLAWWCFDHRRAGLLGAARAPLFGLRGFIILEELVDPASAGLGSAPHAQRALAHHLAPSHPHATLFGLIDATNTPSLRTAARTPRHARATRWFLEPTP